MCHMWFRNSKWTWLEESKYHEYSHHDRVDNAYFTGNTVCDELHPISIGNSVRQVAACRAFPLSVKIALFRSIFREIIDKSLLLCIMRASRSEFFDIFLLRCLQLLLGAFLFTTTWKSYMQTASGGWCGSYRSGNAGRSGRHLPLLNFSSSAFSSSM